MLTLGRLILSVCCRERVKGSVGTMMQFSKHVSTMLSTAHAIVSREEVTEGIPFLCIVCIAMASSQLGHNSRHQGHHPCAGLDSLPLLNAYLLTTQRLSADLAGMVSKEMTKADYARRMRT
jgi:hypothetical protein